MSSQNIAYDLVSPAFFADPHPTLHRMRTEKPMFQHPQLGAWCLTRHADIQRITRDPRFSVQRFDLFRIGASPAVAEQLAVVERFLSHWAALMDPPNHTRMRTLIAKAFTPQTIERLRPEVQRITDRCLDAVIERGEMDVVRDIAQILPAEVIAFMLGVPQEKIPEFRTWSNELIGYSGAMGEKDEPIRAAHRAALGLQGLFRDLIAERRRKPTGDMLSELVAAEEQGSILSEEELVATCAMLLVAGYETTTHLIGNAVLGLVQNPDELEKLRARPELFPSAVEEFLRYDGAAFQISRRAVEDVEIDGTTIRAGEFVFGLVLAANRDPAVFPEPDRLDVERRGAKHVAFGYGIHHCLGAALARMETEIAIRSIVSRLPGLRATGKGPERIPSMAVRGLVSLPVTFEKARIVRAA